MFDKYVNSSITNFSKETEKDSSISLISRMQDVDLFVTSATERTHLVIYKKSLINCLLCRAFHLYSNWSLIHEEINNLKRILLFNKYPSTLINVCIEKFLNNVFPPKPEEKPLPK